MKSVPSEVADQCFFCKAVSNDIAVRKIYEDQWCIAMLDLKPATIGHVLLLPKEHHIIMPQIQDDLLGHLFKIAKKISQALLKVFQAGGTSIFIANGSAAGQGSSHFLMHLMPRRPGDGVNLIIPKNKASPEGLEQTRQQLADKYHEMFITSNLKVTEEDIRGETTESEGPLEEIDPSKVKMQDWGKPEG